MAGYEFESVSPDIDEEPKPGEPAEDLVVRLAEEKAEAVAALQPDGAHVLGFDTAVVLGERVYGKPANEAEAVAMLLSLAGRTHVVYTGYCLAIAGTATGETGLDASRVTLWPVTESVAAEYAASGEPLDKAGAYALQGLGKRFVKGIDGHKSTVIGLPLEPVVDLLTRHGIVPTHSGRP